MVIISDESSTRHQEREAVFGLLSLSQKPAVSENRNSSPNHSTSSGNNQSLNIDPLSSFMDTEQIAHVTKTNYAKNKILDQAVNFNTAKLSEMSFNMNASSQEKRKLCQFLGKSNRNRPLTYPYTSDSLNDSPTLVNSKEVMETANNPVTETVTINEKVSDPIKHFSVVKKYVKYSFEKSAHKPVEEDNQPSLQKQQVFERNKVDDFDNRLRQSVPSIQIVDPPQNIASDLRKRKGSLDHDIAPKMHKSDLEVMDLSVSANAAKPQHTEIIPNGFIHNQDRDIRENPIQTHSDIKKNKEMSNMIIPMANNERGISVKDANPPIFNNSTEETRQHHIEKTSNEKEQNLLKNAETPMDVTEATIQININYVIQDQPNASVDQVNFKQMDYDNSAMETLADIATKQEKLEKNSIAKNVASEFLKLAIKNEGQNSDGLKDANFIASAKDVNELIGKPEENKSCTICSKSFCKPSQLK